MRLARRGQLTLGLRGENRSADYSDSSDPFFPHGRDQLLGGNLSWLWRASDSRQYYLTLARGYKAGGFNIGATIDPAQRRFRAETLWNLEGGLRAHDAAHDLDVQADLYLMRRVDMQVYSSRQLLPDNPLTYVFFTGNAAHGANLGGEGDRRGRPPPPWSLSPPAALQSTRYLGDEADALALP